MGLDQKGAFYAEFDVEEAAAGAGAILAVQNPEGKDLIITRCILHLTDPSADTATVDIGIAANATTLNDTLLDGVSIATAGVFDNIKNKGSNGLEIKLWPAGQYLTMSKASGDSEKEIGAAGKVLVEYART